MQSIEIIFFMTSYDNKLVKGALIGDPIVSGKNNPYPSLQSLINDPIASRHKPTH